MNLSEFTLVMIGVASGSFGAVFLKIGAEKLSQFTQKDIASFFYHIIFEPQIIFGLILYTIPLLLWIWLLRTLPITTLQPVLSLTYIATALIAYFMLGEVLTLQKCLGIGLILVGVIAVAMG